MSVKIIDIRFFIISLIIIFVISAAFMGMSSFEIFTLFMCVFSSFFEIDPEQKYSLKPPAITHGHMALEHL